MKRRKKLWIACAALSVVVAVCAFALFYRPAPYRFLRGSDFREMNFHPAWALYPLTGGSVSEPAFTEQKYRIVKVWGRVVEQAELELTPERGWMRGPERGPAVFRNGDVAVVIDVEVEKSPLQRDIVWVTIVRPPTLLHRAQDWLHNW